MRFVVSFFTLALPTLSYAAPILVVQDTVPATMDAVKHSTITCPGNRVAIWGGVRLFGVTEHVGLLESTRSGSQSWSVGAQEMSVGAYGPWGLTSEVWCAQPAIGAALTAVQDLQSASGGNGVAQAVCPVGTRVISGGARVVGGPPDVVLTASIPTQTEWNAQASEVGASASWEIEATALCLDETVFNQHFTLRNDQINMAPGSAGAGSVTPCPGNSFLMSGGARSMPSNTLGLTTLGRAGSGAPRRMAVEAFDMLLASGSWTIQTAQICYRP